MLDMTECASELLRDEENINNFTAMFETTEGVFVRTLEKEAKRELKTEGKTFEMVCHFEPISIGRKFIILDSAIVYRGKVMNRLHRMHGSSLWDGDTLNIQYTFNS